MNGYISIVITVILAVIALYGISRVFYAIYCNVRVILITVNAMTSELLRDRPVNANALGSLNQNVLNAHILLI